MKSVLIIRHAKSSWSDAFSGDFERPLNERGHRDAPAMAKLLLDKQVAIDAFISSTAKRALTTATYFAEAYGLKKSQVIRLPGLYHATIPFFYETISNIDDSINTATIFSHNPGITGFVNELTHVQIDNMPTCGIFAVKAGIKHWKDFAAAEKTFWFFEYPKK